jgi:hypothetical protein
MIPEPRAAGLGASNKVYRYLRIIVQFTQLFLTSAADIRVIVVGGVGQDEESHRRDRRN